MKRDIILIFLIRKAFKKSVSLRALLIVFAATLGCQGLLNEKQPVPPSLPLDENFPSCFGDVVPAWKRFAEGQSSPAEIEKCWTCVRLTLDSFTRQTQGTSHQSYEREELRTFINNFIVKDNPVTQPLFNEIMLLKKALLGGSELSITTHEIGRLKELTHLIEEEMVQLNPFVNVLLLRAEKALSLDPAIATLTQSGHRIGEILRSHQFRYELGDISRFTDNLSFEDPRSREELRNWFQVAIHLRSMVTGNQSTAVSVEEWPLLLKAGIPAYSLYLEWFYLLKEESWFGEPGFARLRSWAEKLLQTFRFILGNHADQTITFDEIADLLTKLQGVTDTPIPNELVKKYLPVFYSRFVHSTSHSSDEFSPGLNPPALDKISSIFHRWALTQEGILTGNSNPNYETLITLSTQMRPLMDSESFRVLLRYDSGTHTQKSLTALNWLSLATSLFFEAYATGPNGSLIASELPLANPGVPTIGNGFENTKKPELPNKKPNPSDLDNFFLEFEDFLIYLKLIYPKSIKLQPLRTTVESRYLTFQSSSAEAENQNTIKYKEFLEYFAYTVSGIVGARKSFDLLSAQCLVEKRDDFDRPFLDKKCAKDLLHAKTSLFLENLPELQALFNSPERPVWDEFFDLWHKVGESPTHLDFGYEKWEHMLFLLNYVETLILRFDLDRSGFITRNEAVHAFPVYKSLLKLYSPGIDDTFLELGFYFLVAKGRPPLNAFEFIQWQFSSHSRNFRSNRIMIFQIFKSLLGRLGI